MAAQRDSRESLRAFYERQIPALKFGNAIADVVLVPILALNLVGIISINGGYARWVVSVVALIEVISTAILLVSGYLAPLANPHVACANCKGKMTPVVSRWKCESCAAELIPPSSSQPPTKGPTAVIDPEES